jgi:hypothetical protein
MTSIAAKALYVRSQRQTRAHVCHWPGCQTQVPPAMWGCRRHWMMLPLHIRNNIWSAYRPGQEVALDPSRAYLRAAREAQEWIEAFIASQPKETDRQPRLLLLD